MGHVLEIKSSLQMKRSGGSPNSLGTYIIMVVELKLMVTTNQNGFFSNVFYNCWEPAVSVTETVSVRDRHVICKMLILILGTCLATFVLRSRLESQWLQVKLKSLKKISTTDNNGQTYPKPMAILVPRYRLDR